MKIIGFVENSDATIAVGQHYDDLFFFEPEYEDDTGELKTKVGDAIDFPDEWYFCVEKKSLKKFVKKLK